VFVKIVETKLAVVVEAVEALVATVVAEDLDIVKGMCKPFVSCFMLFFFGRIKIVRK
jgi:hypothetical protein